MDAFGAVMNLCRQLDYGSEKKKMSMQVLSPMYRGTCGVDHLNHAIQELVHGHPLEGGAHFSPAIRSCRNGTTMKRGVQRGSGYCVGRG